MPAKSKRTPTTTESDEEFAAKRAAMIAAGKRITEAVDVIVAAAIEVSGKDSPSLRYHATRAIEASCRCLLGDRSWIFDRNRKDYHETFLRDYASQQGLRLELDGDYCLVDVDTEQTLFHSEDFDRLHNFLSAREHGVS